ncbi:MAG: hypothetical protein RL417_2280, partial [Pseudomonadota bacterium]
EERGFLGGGRFGAWRDAEEALKPPSFPVVFPDGIYWMVVVRRCLLEGVFLPCGKPVGNLGGGCYRPGNTTR